MGAARSRHGMCGPPSVQREGVTGGTDADRWFSERWLCAWSCQDQRTLKGHLQSGHAQLSKGGLGSQESSGRVAGGGTALTRAPCGPHTLVPGEAGRGPLGVSSTNHPADGAASGFWHFPTTRQICAEHPNPGRHGGQGASGPIRSDSLRTEQEGRGAASLANRAPHPRNRPIHPPPVLPAEHVCLSLFSEGAIPYHSATRGPGRCPTARGVLSDQARSLRHLTPS